MSCKIYFTNQPKFSKKLANSLKIFRFYEFLDIKKTYDHINLELLIEWGPRKPFVPARIDSVPVPV